MIIKENKKEFAKALDRWIKAKWAIDAIDGVLFTIVTGWIDKFFETKIPEEYAKEINQFIEHMSMDEFEQASAVLGPVLAKVIPTPEIDEIPLESKLYSIVLNHFLKWVLEPLPNPDKKYEVEVEEKKDEDEEKKD